MPQDYFHGSRTLEYEDGVRYIRTVDSSTVGLIAMADDADPTLFPEGEVVSFAGFDPSVLAKAGDHGTLAPTLDAIYDQGYAPLTAVVRVAHSDNQSELIDNVAKGCLKLQTSQNRFGYTPRILGAPGLDKQLDIVKEIEQTAHKLCAFAYLGLEADSPADAVTYRNHFGSDRVMLIWPDFKNSSGDLLASARALGLRAKLDNDVGWHRVLSNAPVLGVSDMNRDVTWNLQTSDHEAHYLNSHEVTTLINEKGYRFWGSRTTTANPKYCFENYRRTADILGYSFAQALFDQVDAPMSRVRILDMIDSINQKYQELTNKGFILGGQCWIDQEDNLSGAIMDGKLVLKRNFTPVPPMESITQQQIITDEYVVNLF